MKGGTGRRDDTIMQRVPIGMTADFDYAPAQPRKNSGMRWWLILIIAAFVLGIAAAGWLITRSPFIANLLGADATVPVAQNGAKVIADTKQQRSAAVAGIADLQVAQVGGQVASLETRLAQLTSQADAAASNAARAEGMLIAFAARRAIDRGQPLGYLEGQLQLRFGNAQPNAVATIIEGAQNPVTIDVLRQQLEDLAPRLVSGTAKPGLWNRIENEMGSLFVIRSTGTPPPLPEMQLDRARRHVDAGRIDAAMAEVRRMPGNAMAKKWLTEAERHVAIQRALDLVETAAILDPRQALLPAAPRAGEATEEAAGPASAPTETPATTPSPSPTTPPVERKTESFSFF